MDLSDAPTETAIKRRRNTNRREPAAAISVLTADLMLQEPVDFTSVAVLCGRESQEEALLAAYQRVATGQSEVVLIHGASGTGKSSLVETMRESVTTNDGGYFTLGKFDQLTTSKEPFSAIAAAFSDICDLIVQSSQFNDRRRSICDALGADSQILSRAISNITAITTTSGEENSQASEGSFELIDAESFTRFDLACQKFLRTVATEDHPLLIFLDDLQWADEMSVRLIKSITRDLESKHVLLCLAYRDDEIDGKELLGLVEYESDNETSSDTIQHVGCTDITVKNLDSGELCSMLAQLLHMDADSVEEFASLLLDKTIGNPNAVVQLLQHLETKKYLTFSDETYSWEWNMSAIESEVSDNPSAIIAEKIGLLPVEEQEMLKLAAFLGNSFDVELLQIVSSLEWQHGLSSPKLGAVQSKAPKKDERADAAIIRQLQCHVAKGLIKKSGKGSYTFVHDSIQHYLCNSVENESEGELIHFQIGRGLAAFAARHKNKAIEDQILFLAASNMTRGAKHIESDSERLATMQLFLDVAMLAVSKVAIMDARSYLVCALSIMRKSDYETHYDLCIDLQNTYAEVCSCSGYFEEGDKAITIVLEDARFAKHRLRAHCTKIRLLINQKQYKQMLELTCGVVLRDLGEKISIRPSIAQLLVELARVKIAMRKVDTQDFLTMPMAMNEQKVAVFKVLNIVNPVTFLLPDKVFYTYCCLRQIRLSVKYGISAFTSSSIALYAVLLLTMKKADQAYELGRVAVEMSSRDGQDATSRSICLTSVCLCIYPLRDRLENLVGTMFDSYKVGLMCGSDIAIAFYGLFGYLTARNLLGAPLSELEDEFRRCCRRMEGLHVNHLPSYVTVMWQYTLNLLGRCDDPLILTGEVMDEQQQQQRFEDSGDDIGLRLLTGFRLRLQISFEDWEAMKGTLPLVQKTLGIFDAFSFYFWTADVILASLGLYERTQENKYKRMAKKTIRRMTKWSKAKVPSMEPLMALIDVEWKAVVDKNATVDGFETAITLLKGAGFVTYEMIAYQRAMHFMLGKAEVQKACTYLTRSLGRHREWGNVAKVQWLENAYSDMLTLAKPMFVVEVTEPAPPLEDDLCFINMNIQ